MVTISKEIYFYVTSSYLWILLLLSGDIELNPGPANLITHFVTLTYVVYIGHLSILFSNVSNLFQEKMIKGIEIYEDVSPDESINDVKAIFNNLS